MVNLDEDPLDFGFGEVSVETGGTMATEIKTDRKTCGDCKYFTRNEWHSCGICDAELPQWALSALSAISVSGMVKREDDASYCDSFKSAAPKK